MTSFKITGEFIVSGNPPLLDIITAFPLEPASKEVLPKGSAQLDGTTVMDDLEKYFKTFS